MWLENIHFLLIMMYSVTSTLFSSHRNASRILSVPTLEFNYSNIRSYNNYRSRCTTLPEHLCFLKLRWSQLFKLRVSWCIWMRCLVQLHTISGTFLTRSIFWDSSFGNIFHPCCYAKHRMGLTKCIHHVQCYSYL